MRGCNILLAAAAIVGTASASPTQKLDTRAYAGPYAQQLIEAIDSTTDTCDKAPAPDQCRTAEQAAPFFIDAMAKYGIYEPFEIAAVIALVLHESAGLKYKQPSSAPQTDPQGKGTSNMQSGDYNVKYAKSIPELATQVQTITGGSDTPDTAQKNQILKLLQDDKYTFASGAWFLATQCQPQIRADLQARKPDAWMNYMIQCVQVPKTPADEFAKRERLWAAAQDAFGVAPAS